MRLNLTRANGGKVRGSSIGEYVAYRDDLVV